MFPPTSLENRPRRTPGSSGGGTVNEQIDLPSASKIGLESVPLWRLTFQPHTLSAMHRVADSHASIVKYFGIDDLIADLKLSVATANLNLQIAVKAAGATVPIGWNLQNHATNKQQAANKSRRTADASGAMMEYEAMSSPATRKTHEVSDTRLKRDWVKPLHCQAAPFRGNGLFIRVIPPTAI